MIKIDITMPKCCDECFALDDRWDYPCCLISGEQRGYNFRTQEYRMPHCPLIDQEPKVLTIEEVRNSKSNLWTEITSPGIHGRCLIYCRVIANKNYPDMVTLQEDSGTAWGRLWEDYNHEPEETWHTGWRCWTAEPSKSQMEDTKWDEND